MTYKGASILPVAIDRRCGNVYLLLGQEAGEWCEGGLWSDFGGGRVARDRSAAHTAAREFLEETLYTLPLFGCAYVNGIARALTARNHAMRIRVRRNGREAYNAFVVRVPFSPLAVRRFAHSRRLFPQSEKQRLAWWSLDALRQMVSGSSSGIHALRRNFANLLCVVLQRLFVVHIDPRGTVSIPRTQAPPARNGASDPVRQTDAPPRARSTAHAPQVCSGEYSPQ